MRFATRARIEGGRDGFKNTNDLGYRRMYAERELTRATRITSTIILDGALRFLKLV